MCSRVSWEARTIRSQSRCNVYRYTSRKTLSHTIFMSKSDLLEIPFDYFERLEPTYFCPQTGFSFFNMCSRVPWEARMIFSQACFKVYRYTSRKTLSHIIFVFWNDLLEISFKQKTRKANFVGFLFLSI